MRRPNPAGFARRRDGTAGRRERPDGRVHLDVPFLRARTAVLRPATLSALCTSTRLLVRRKEVPPEARVGPRTASPPCPCAARWPSPWSTGAPRSPSVLPLVGPLAAGAPPVRHAASWTSPQRSSSSRAHRRSRESSTGAPSLRWRPAASMGTPSSRPLTGRSSKGAASAPCGSSPCGTSDERGVMRTTCLPARSSASTSWTSSRIRRDTNGAPWQRRRGTTSSSAASWSTAATSAGLARVCHPVSRRARRLGDPPIKWIGGTRAAWS